MPAIIARSSGSYEDQLAKVIPTYPLSGSYGLGSRVLFYALVFLCVVAQKIEFLRGASLAAALVLPALASLHAVVLATLSNEHIVDLDIYGTLQVMALGTLAAGITIRYSHTYFNAPGRNLVFLWTILNLAGLLGLAVSFWRAKPHECLDDTGTPLTVAQFIAQAASLGQNQTLDFCHWPSRPLARSSPIRPADVNTVQFVLRPHRGMTLPTAILVSLGCCVPAVISVAAMWQKVIYANAVRLGWMSEEDVERKTRATDSESMQAYLARFLGMVERIVFMGLFLGVGVLGEINFFSPEMLSGVEPMAAVGQWSPIVGAVLTTIGSAYATLSLRKKEGKLDIGAHDTRSIHSNLFSLSTIPPPEKQFRRRHSIATSDVSDTSIPFFNAAPPFPTHDHASPLHSATPARLVPILQVTGPDESDTRSEHPAGPPASDDEHPALQSSRRTWAALIVRASDWLGTPSPERVAEQQSMRRGHYNDYNDYPVTPGEHLLNANLAATVRWYRLRNYGTENISLDDRPGVPSRASSGRSEEQTPTPGSSSDTSGRLAPPPDPHRSSSSSPAPLPSPGPSRSGSNHDNTPISFPVSRL